MEMNRSEPRSGGTGSGLAPWLALWGAVGIVRALLDWGTYWMNLIAAGQALTWGALAVTAAGAVVWLLRHPAAAKAHGLRTALPLLTVLAGVALLDYVGAIDAFFAPMLRALVLSAVFVYAGVSGYRGMLAVGLWLFAAAAVMGVWYLGYAPMVLEGMSGLALLAAAWLLRPGRRPARS
ncbi:hypothetical protein ACFFK0_13300 [Paenibacillus chartarius]|uniref:Uncharacterized protein n=1 Tax=Paenibacillus chartarius TaxID=747481 RepID=A0ABV6DL86_9BACL